MTKDVKATVADVRGPLVRLRGYGYDTTLLIESDDDLEVAQMMLHKLYSRYKKVVEESAAPADTDTREGVM